MRPGGGAGELAVRSHQRSLRAYARDGCPATGRAPAAVALRTTARLQWARGSAAGNCVSRALAWVQDRAYQEVDALEALGYRPGPQHYNPLIKAEAAQGARRAHTPTARHALPQSAVPSPVCGELVCLYASGWASQAGPFRAASSPRARAARCAAARLLPPAGAWRKARYLLLDAFQKPTWSPPSVDSFNALLEGMVLSVDPGTPPLLLTAPGPQCDTHLPRT